jgi:hypothetical protein
MLKIHFYALLLSFSCSLLSCELTISNNPVSQEVFEAFKKDIIDNPVKVIARAIKLRELTTVVKTDVYANQPFGYMRDCSDPACKLARAHNPQGARQRDFFERAVANSLVKHSKDVDRPTYVDVGSGELLSLARILTLAHLHDVKKLNVLAVDPLYTNLVTNFKAQNTIKICDVSKFTGNVLLNSFMRYATKLFGQGNLSVTLYDPQTFLETIRTTKPPIHLYSACDTTYEAYTNTMMYLNHSATEKTEAHLLNKDAHNDQLISLLPAGTYTDSQESIRANQEREFLETITTVEKEDVLDANGHHFRLSTINF